MDLPYIAEGSCLYEQAELSYPGIEIALAAQRLDGDGGGYLAAGETAAVKQWVAAEAERLKIPPPF